MSFRELANRLRGLCVRQPAPTNEQARHEINAVIAQAIALYKDKADAGVTGFNSELVRIRLTKDSAKNQALLLTNTQGLPRWLDIIADLGKQCPGRVSVDPGAPRYKRQNRARGVEMATTSSPQYSQDGLDLVVKTYSPEDWPQRAPEYASVLELLAALAGEEAQAVDSTIAGSRPATIASMSSTLAHPAAKLPELKPHDRQAWQLATLHGMTQHKVAEALNKEHGKTYTQGQVSKMIARAKAHANASGLSEKLSEPIDRPRTVDPGRLDLGARVDKRTPRPSDMSRVNDDEE